MFPKFEEQQKIGEFFSSLDNIITLHQRKVDQIKEYKKGLLQQMFVWSVFCSKRAWESPGPFLSSSPAHFLGYELRLERDLMIISISLLSNSWIIWRYVFWVVVILECPNLLATLAMDTPAKRRRDACVWRKPWTEITGMPAFLQCLARRSLTVELKTRPFTKIGVSDGRFLNNSANWITTCQSNGIFLTEDWFFVGRKPPFPL